MFSHILLYTIYVTYIYKNKNTFVPTNKRINICSYIRSYVQCFKIMLTCFYVPELEQTNIYILIQTYVRIQIQKNNNLFERNNICLVAQMRLDSETC